MVAVEDLSPAAVETFLKVSGWLRTDWREGLYSIWESTTERASLMVPFDRSYRDFPARLRDALATIADVYEIGNDEDLALEIAGARHDILLVRADQTTVDGSIPLSEAQNLLTGVSQMLSAAACSAIRPRASNQGRRPDAVKEFLAEEVRMGHTLRGSFVLTILAQHDEEMSEELPVQGGSEAAAIGTYTRRVMTTLATGLTASRDLLEGEQVELDEAVQNGASAELIDSIDRMSQFPGLRALDVSFRWSPSQPQPVDTASRVVLRRPDPDRIHFVRDALRQRPVVEQDDVTGQVIRLERAEGQDEGVVVIDGSLGRTRRRVKMRLAGDDYRLALRAHDERRAVVASGIVVLEKRSWWLGPPVRIRSVS
ncbi:hypothetical protein [Herbidospora mongoliensis]|uniref:hypothetical protein n=1 Tax=Herbidospora mongoliensis TaxID=688067 RepID=UPI00082E3829|nr:hypothetical protein [Herbidospora mongoliensis]